MTPQNYKVFIASSLSLRDDRQEVENAVNEVNDILLKDSYFKFSIFDYVKDETIVQKIEHGDAQDPIRRCLYESLVFVLIVRGRVGNLTINEFEDAMSRFREGRLPQYLFIFYDEDSSRDSIKDDKSISYAEFENKYLAKYELDSAYRLVKHERGYHIPFNGKFKSLQSQLVENLANLIRSDEWPFPGSIRNDYLKKTDFYSDENRLAQCHKGIYFSRPFDKVLDESIDSSQVLFINGVSLSGKTRAVMNLLSTKDNGWTYILPAAEIIDRESAIINDMARLVKYFESKSKHPSHYIFIDDIHELDFSDDEESKEYNRQRKILSSFVSAAVRGGYKLIVTSTRKFQDTFLSDFISEEDNAVQAISIREMRDAEFTKAINYFNGYGLINHDRRGGYNTPGALLIDLSKIKGSYSSFLKSNNERILTVRRCFLKSIKAASIWKNTNFGEITVLKRLTGFFLEQEGIEDYTDKEIEKAIASLIGKPQCGVTIVGKTRLNIQEYVYRYIIDYDGNIREGTDDLVEAEKRLVSELMTYCERYEKDSPLTMQACKLGSRTEYRSIIGAWLYGIFINENGVLSGIGWAQSLLEEKHDKEAHPLEAKEDRFLFYYSKMFSNAFDANTQFKDAFAIYSRANDNLRSPNLLADLMRCAHCAEDWQVVVSLPEYDKYVLEEKQPFVLARLMSLQKDFSQALFYFNSLANRFDCTPQQVANYRILSFDGPIKDESIRKIQRDVYPIETGIETLARNVRCEAEFDALIDIIRQYYFVKITDRHLLTQISESKLDILSRENDLTMVDLLSVLSIYSLRKAIQGAYRSTSEDKTEMWNDLSHVVDDFLKGTLYPSFKQTLENKYTDEARLRRTASAIINALIEAYGSNKKSSVGLSYNALREQLVEAAYINHPLSKGIKMNLMDCYAYSHMLKARDCGAQETRNLLEEYVIPHTQDDSNPIVLSVYLLNSMISTVWKDTKGKEKNRTEKTRRAIIQKILPLYNQFSISPDIITYNILIEASHNEAEAIRYIKQMVEEGLNPDIYTLCYLASKTDNIQGALGLISIPEEILLPNDYELREVLPDSVRNLATIVEQKKILLDSKEYWKQVFFRELKSDDDRLVALNCFNYLRDYKPELLSDGMILNVFIQNNSNLIRFESIKGFILENYGGAFPDGVTFSNLSNRIAELRGSDKRKELSFYNELTQRMYSEGRLDWDELLPRRLYLFDTLNEHLDFVFVYRDEEDNEVFQIKNVTAIGYLQVLKNNQYNPSIEFIYKSLNKIDGFVRDEEAQRIAKELFPYSPHYNHNQKVVHAFQHGKSYNIWKAMEKLDWDDYTSAIHAFNRILEIWSKRTPYDSFRFDAVVIKLYERYLQEKGLSSETLSIFVKNANSYEDVIAVYRIFDETKRKKPELRLDSHFLSSVYRFGRSISDLVQYTQVFEQRGGIPSIGNAASMIRHMLKFKYDQEAINTLTEICELLFGENNISLSKYNTPIGLLTRDSVNGQILYSAIVFATENHLFRQEDIINSLVGRYRKTLLNFNEDGLFLQLLKQKRADNKHFLSILLTRLLEQESIIRIPESILSASIEGIDNYSDYCRLILALKSSDCSFIEPIVLPLLSFLVVWIRMKNSPYLKEVRQLYSRIVTYSKLNILTNGHLLPTNNALNMTDSWSSKSLNCAIIRAAVESVVGHRSFKDQIVFAIRNLPNPYLLALKSVYYYERPRLTIEADTRDYLVDFEKRFAKKIQKGDVRFDEMIQLPMEWEKSGWIPGAEIVAALYYKYRALSRNSTEKSIREESLKYIKSMNTALWKANKNKWTEVHILYSSMGRLNETEQERNHYTKICIQDFVDEVDEQLRCSILQGKLTFEEMVQLASEWDKSGWRPGVSVIASLFIQYKSLSKTSADEQIREEARRYYLSMCGEINKAKKINSRLLKFYLNELGRLSTNNCHFITVDKQAFYEHTKNTIAY